jgi:hypothetical protein
LLTTVAGDVESKQDASLYVVARFEARWWAEKSRTWRAKLTNTRNN